MKSLFYLKGQTSLLNVTYNIDFLDVVGLQIKCCSLVYYSSFVDTLWTKLKSYYNLVLQTEMSINP